MPLPTQVFKWVLINYWGTLTEFFVVINVRWTSIPPRERSHIKTPSLFVLQNQRYTQRERYALKMLYFVNKIGKRCLILKKRLPSIQFNFVCNYVRISKTKRLTWKNINKKAVRGFTTKGHCVLAGKKKQRNTEKRYIPVHDILTSLVCRFTFASVVLGSKSSWDLL